MNVDVLVVGGGLAGSLAAWRLHTTRADLVVGLLESDDRLGGNHTWSFHATDIADDAVQWLSPLVAARWPRHQVAFQSGTRTIEQEYCSVSSERLHAVVAPTLGERVRFGVRVERLTPTEAHTTHGETWTARVVIDARGAQPTPLPLGWQTFLGQDLECETPHGVRVPMIMDATGPQTGAFKFMYLLPWSPTRLLIEDTAYADLPGLDREAARAAIAAYADARHWRGRRVVREESGCLPIPLGGQLTDIWADGIPRLGMRAGLFHPTTGYSLPDAVATADLLASLNPLTPARVYSEVRALAERRWRERGFFRLLNRWLFRAAAPEARVRVLEQFYQRSPDIIARFYAARLTPMDRLRLLSGRPPVSIWRALAHVRE